MKSTWQSIKPDSGTSFTTQIQIFNNHEVETFWKHCGKKRKFWLTSIFSISRNVFKPIWQQ